MYSIRTTQYPHIYYKWEWWKSPEMVSSSSQEKNKNTLDKWINTLTGMMILPVNIWIAYDAWNTVEKAKSSNNPTVKDTLKILEATGIISGNMTSLLARWWEGSGKSWAKKIIEALETAEKWEIQIITYSNNSYATSSLKGYEKSVTTDTNTMNVSAMKWLYSLRWTGIWFSESTWAKIWLYIYSYNESWLWKDSRLVKDLDTNSIADLKKLWESMKSKEVIKLDIIANTILAKIRSENANMSQLLVHTDLKMNSDNKTIDVSAIIASFEKDKDKLTIEQIEAKFRELALMIKKNGDMLITQWKQTIKDIPGNPKTLREIGIKNIPYTRFGKQINLSDELIANTNPEEASAMIVAIDVYKKSIEKQSTNYNEKNETIEQILRSLLLIREGKKMSWQAWQLEVTANAIKKQRASGKNRNDWKIPSEQLLQTANNIAIASAQLQSTQNDLESYDIHTLDQARDKLKILRSKSWNHTSEEKYLIKLLEQYIRDHYDSAKQYQMAQESLWTEVAQEIFSQTDQLISENPKKIYDFNQLEKIAILWDNELTVGNRALTQMKPWETISMQKLLEWEWDNIDVRTISEISSMKLMMNSDGTYQIPLLWEYHLTKNEVQEYIIDIALYSDLWLQQFIPHIPLITTELRNKWIDTAVDGNTGTMEQQRVLKYIYALLFAENMARTMSLPEVKHAFRSKLDNPINMKDSMQPILKDRNLIRESDQPIDPDIFRKWMRWT